MAMSVRPVSSATPAIIADLVASPNPLVEGPVSLTWTAPQGNAGGHPIANQPVAAYLIHYSTISVASLGGNTTSWWNATLGTEQMLQAPANTPQAPGQLEAFTFASLTPGDTYYFGIKSISMSGITSPIDAFATTSIAQAKAVVTHFPTAADVPPMRPNGLSSSASGGIFTLQWHPVTLNNLGGPVALDHYSIYRYEALNSTPTLVGTIGAGTHTFNDAIGGLVYYYRIVAVSATNRPSVPSDYMDSSGPLNRYVLAPSESASRITLPQALARELNSESNGTGDDYEIVAIRQTQNENSTTLKSYLFQVQNARTGVPITGFSFTQPIAEVQLSYGISVPTLGLNSQFGGLDTGQASAIAQLISLYWYNGASFIRVGGTVVLANQALMITARNMGLYEVRAISMPTSFSLTRNSPYPRVITPNHPSQNNRVFWFFDNPTDESVVGTIYDIRGAKVRDLVVDSLSPTPNSLVWDGHDSNGAVVPSGVYLYKIQAGKEKATGTIVVAR